jgi:predicted TIM-barrel fold metal-dependent hydrolase
MAASLARRRAAREPRVVLVETNGAQRTLEPDDPAAEPLLDAAERLISAAQSQSAV